MGGRSFTYEEVAEFFRAAGCILLSLDYTGSQQRLRYLCGCGAEAETRFGHFKSKVSLGQRRGCPRCSVEKMLETTRTRNGGLLPFETDDFLRRREETNLKRFGTANPMLNDEVRQKRKANTLSRYGVPSTNQVPEIKVRQREGFKEKYGVGHFSKHPPSKEKYHQTMLGRYGAPSLAFVSRRTSNESSTFFGALFALMPLDTHEKCYFAPHTREFNVWYERKYYKYDFVHSRLKKAIEYNGSRFHPRPEQHDDEVGWCLFRPTRTVREAREYEQHKLDAIRARGFEVLVVWDYEVKHDLNSALDRCLSFLGITTGTRPTSPPSSPSPSGS